MNHTYTLHPRLAFQDVEEGIFVITPDNNLHHLKDEVALFLWEQLNDSPKSLNELTKAVTENFEVEKTAAQQDLEDFLNTGIKKGLLETVKD